MLPRIDDDAGDQCRESDQPEAQHDVVFRGPGVLDDAALRTSGLMIVIVDRQRESMRVGEPPRAQAPAAARGYRRLRRRSDSVAGTVIGWRDGRDRGGDGDGGGGHGDRSGDGNRPAPLWRPGLPERGGRRRVSRRRLGRRRPGAGGGVAGRRKRNDRPQRGHFSSSAAWTSCAENTCVQVGLGQGSCLAMSEALVAGGIDGDACLFHYLACAANARGRFGQRTARSMAPDAR